MTDLKEARAEFSGEVADMSDRCNAQHWFGTDPVGTSMQCVLDRHDENPHEDVNAFCEAAR